MSLADIAHDLGLYFKYRDVAKTGIAALLKYVDIDGLKADPDAKALLDALPKIASDFSGGAKNKAVTPRKIVSDHGIDPDELIDALKKPDVAAGNPDANSAGSNNASI